jgi:hypothetical protein
MYPAGIRSPCSAAETTPASRRLGIRWEPASLPTAIGSLDHLPGDGRSLLDSRQKQAVIAGVHPAVDHPREVVPEGGEQGQLSLAVANISCGYEGFHDAPQRIGEQVALAAVDLLGTVIAVGAPFSVVLTDWLSGTTALGAASRRCVTRYRSRGIVSAASHRPSSRHSRKE